MIETKFTTSMPAETAPKSAGESSRASTASDPRVTRPWTTAPPESQSHPPSACSVRVARVSVAGRELMSGKPSPTSMARGAPAVAERWLLARHLHKLPAIAGVRQRQLQHAVEFGGPHLTVRRQVVTERVGCDAPRANGDLPNSCRSLPPPPNDGNTASSPLPRSSYSRWPRLPAECAPGTDPTTARSSS